MTALDEELFLPDPLAREVKYTMISVDDHVVEPPHMFEGRVPAHLADRAPPSSRSTTRATRCGSSRARQFNQIGMNAVAGRRPESVRLEPFRFDQMRPGLLRRRCADTRHGRQRRLGDR